ncbi:MAG TPA: hypothetical protein PLN05_06705 [Pyrinomonadaceae bacterium]|nr:hypothetical protein [Chloracidobacterium sp.]HBE83699.1 hypothetical protein [Blastocatellia bacterium]HRJ89670.1 hypothetical protein [Pyrinomonadaceae bacterium]HRK50102.1 hypothetical protein [Pyrinomonadaceae bacterium]
MKNKIRSVRRTTTLAKRNWMALTFLITAVFLTEVAAQTTAFTYQGKLNDGGTAANGSYDMLFKLFDAQADGAQVGGTLNITNVQAVAGIFSVSLDFGSAAFSGADRFMEIAISPAGQGNFTILTPRQKLNSSPYSIQTLNAANAVTALNALNLGGVAATEFVQDDDTRLSDARTPLPGSADYIQNGTTVQTGTNFSISGTGVANAFDAVQYRINGSRFLSAPGTQNVFVGPDAGLNVSSGFNNTFFGSRSGLLNTTGNHNTFIGHGSGIFNTFGSNNIFIGQNAGNPNNTTQVSGSIAIGNGAVVEQSNTIILGTPAQATIARGKLVAGFPTGSVPFTPGAGWIETWSIPSGPDGIFAGNLVLRDFLNRPPSTAGPICYSNFSFGLTGGVILNRCSSSFSFAGEKSGARPFTGGIDLIRLLNPVAFKRQSEGPEEIGLNVDDIAATAPLLVARNEKGEVDRISENALTVVLINAVKQQQKQIESQERQLKEQQRQIELLRNFVCAVDREASICKEN